MSSEFRYILQNLQHNLFNINQRMTVTCTSTGIYIPIIQIEMNVQDKNLILPNTFGVHHRIKNSFLNFGDKYAQEHDFPIVRSFE